MMKKLLFCLTPHGQTALRTVQTEVRRTVLDPHVFQSRSVLCL